MRLRFQPETFFACVLFVAGCYWVAGFSTMRVVAYIVLGLTISALVWLVRMVAKFTKG